MELDQQNQKAGTEIPQTSIILGLLDLLWIRYSLIPWDELLHYACGAKFFEGKRLQMHGGLQTSWEPKVPISCV